MSHLFITCEVYK